jgi:hypothetical protein
VLVLGRFPGWQSRPPGGILEPHLVLERLHSGGYPGGSPGILSSSGSSGKPGSRTFYVWIVGPSPTHEQGMGHPGPQPGIQNPEEGRSALSVIPERHPGSSSIASEGGVPAEAINLLASIPRLSLRTHEMGVAISFPSPTPTCHPGPRAGIQNPEEWRCVLKNGNNEAPFSGLCYVTLIFSEGASRYSGAFGRSPRKPGISRIHMFRRRLSKR